MNGPAFAPSPRGAVGKKFDWPYPGPGEGISLHNHSTWSDGAADAETMCRAAKAAGLRVFGLSDHYTIHPDFGAVDWSLPRKRAEAYCAEMDRLKKLLSDDRFTLLAGLEVDFFPENCEEVFALLENCPLDYLIGSVHYAGKFPIDCSARHWEALSGPETDAVCRLYWEKLRMAAECGKFAFLGHLDLPKKFGNLRGRGDFLREAERVLDAAAATRTAIELNTSGWFKPCAEPYPAPAMLRAAAARHIPVVVNADAHRPEDVTRAFPEARELLLQAGFPAPKPV